MKYNVVSYQVADSIDLKSLKENFKAKPVFSDADELYYQMENSRYLSVFRYGVLSFLNYENEEVDKLLSQVEPFCRNRFFKPLTDEFVVETNAPEKKISHNKIEIVDEDPRVLRMIMLTLAQSVALDFYSQQSFSLLEDTNFHTQLLERKGRLSISGSNLKKYIGKTLILKNRISQHLYIFDSPPDTWEDERLDKLHTELKRNFDLTERFRGVTESLGIVKENLELFRDLLQYRTGVVLEWIIIILIAIEVVHFMYAQIF
ncbi:MAG TPA: RMD1 family protein [Chitinophagaceae bacterium]|nr:RMD1 family protein [Chitinophagaceae bacterium]